MGKTIAIIYGHPDTDRSRFGFALANAYTNAAQSAGHSVEVIELSKLEIPFLQSRGEWEEEDPPPFVQKVQSAIAAAEHVVFIYPLWLGSMPAKLKAFFEQTFRPGFAIERGKRSMWPGKLTGKSARVIITMGMPGFVYRWYFMAHSLKSLERNILQFVGFRPIRHTIIGNVEGSQNARLKWLDRVRELGKRGI